ncbi:hypothetical protein P12x_000084 [Tundrisphaera lichenicola]|uniref:hypothetical protein n=1 Tax=Tundrisphaera lichenicola TaxID=2029860 RepID=UPI003EBA0702
MEFMEFPPRKKRRRIVDHLMIFAVAALALVVFGRADDEVTGKAQVSDAFGFTMIFVVAAYYIEWLPAIWERTRRTAFEPFVMPAFIAMVLAYLYFSFRSYFIQPGATSLAVFSQLFAMIVLSCRMR